MAAPAIYPTLLGLDINVIWRPKALNFKPQPHTSGREVVVAASAYPLHEFELNYEFLLNRVVTEVDFKTLMGFFLQVSGSLNGFLFSNPQDNQVLGQAVATGDGATVQFPLLRTYGAGGYGASEPVGYVNLSGPVLNGAGSFNVYLNGVLQSTSSYSVSQLNPPGPGEPSNQILVFGSAPGSGVAITVDMSYYYWVRFGDDTIDFEQFMYNVFDAKKVLLVSKRPT